MGYEELPPIIRRFCTQAFCVKVLLERFFDEAVSEGLLGVSMFRFGMIDEFDRVDQEPAESNA